MAKKTSDTVLVNTAERVGRTLGRIAKQLDKVKAIRKKPAASKAKKTKKDPVTAEKQAKAHAEWKAQEKAAASAVKAKHGATVDERALARATTGQHWAARKPR